MPNRLHTVLLSLSFLMPLTLQAQDARLQEDAGKLARSAQSETLAWDILESLTTEVGPRLAGTEAEARAREWAVQKLQALGFKNVRVEPFDLPVWERGIETAEILAPFPQPLAVTALGGSVSTGADGVVGDVAAVATVAELEAAAPGSLKGKIVFVNEVMTRTQDGSGYGVAASKRRTAAYAAEKQGAAAVLIRSVGTSHHRFPHAGQMRRVTATGESPGVPAAALSAPDADQLQRILQRGASVKLRLRLTPELRPGGRSGNVIAEIPGTLAADEIVLVGAHLDSWDLGTGAVDDGAGVAIVTAAAKHVMDASRRGPLRTVRIVLFGAEEVGLVGARAYTDQHADELDNHIVAMESDFGAGKIWRFDTNVAEDRLDAAQALWLPLREFGVGPGNNNASGGPDLTFLGEAGVPILGLVQNGWDYFDLHHTADDTLDKVDPENLAQNVAVYSAVLYQLANGSESLR